MLLCMQGFQASPPPPSGQEMATFLPQERAVNIKFSKASSALAKAMMKMLTSLEPHPQTYTVASRSPHPMLSAMSVSATPEKPDDRIPTTELPHLRGPRPDPPKHTTRDAVSLLSQALGSCARQPP